MIEMRNLILSLAFNLYIPHFMHEYFLHMTFNQYYVPYNIDNVCIDANVNIQKGNVRDK